MLCNDAFFKCNLYYNSIIPVRNNTFISMIYNIIYIYVYMYISSIISSWSIILSHQSISFFDVLVSSLILQPFLEE